MTVIMSTLILPAHNYELRCICVGEGVDGGVQLIK